MITRVWVAAPIASSSNCRSSERMSRSPVIGSRASTSSPSGWLSRGNTPSSRPTRHTTRCGTERIGTIVQTVSVPVRKLARVGRPASCASKSARTSGSRNSGAAREPARASTSANSRCTCARCQPSLQAVSRSIPVASASSHATNGRAPLSPPTT
ncbi:Uncharacterised protein [Mycobacterium tuberculosis]|uniref:Uncharacterized protein n=1 Tax=Mycobacterium tuberculosis TaxID=1773 RepID=A0A654TG35_MYCTX|nr:Uncharacterised protein [Mycobacterium tuberculosis]CNM49846.1 Uncharacterised protein [Mycobacterium tuberculosis]CNM89091.1 Uncharacterised protein [Mycobacterium tuberculosis]CNM98970.1 Uncharacterised protein [Mycobacterium tuberculosis]CNN25252.1 Uncharacterised protein [Mycobacterium tuberculosis]